jgi:hypothetical protein
VNGNVLVKGQFIEAKVQIAGRNVKFVPPGGLEERREFGRPEEQIIVRLVSFVALQFEPDAVPIQKSGSSINSVETGFGISRFGRCHRKKYFIDCWG